MDEDTIVAVEVQDTDYGEKVVLKSPFDAKDFIKVLPWKELSEEVSEHGSIREKAVSRGVSEDSVAIKAIEDYMEQEGLPADFATHVSWDPNALGYEEGGWTIDTDALDDAFAFFEFAGFETENRTSL
jgi:hypothetical protein